ncbi:uroporphyrinogen decarboxylase [candidate division KSB3 bacterium]|uniref:Uroporphyrinogen decarboxylase n=1 Tax=candidate division KSB3 bacterium TaxID=2044937 RepID=A0A2G6KJ07_9BACT|nr:MAG: uroporphyrinogen decarboxylase [candidate division KSB3 bacterium]
MGKQLLFDAIQGKKTERPPWLAFIGCHGGKLIGTAADEYLRSGDCIVRGIREAIAQYRPDGISVTFDLQVEAEALGCGLQWTQEKPPTVVSHVLENTALGDLHVPGERSGRIPEILTAIRRLRADQHDLALYGLITGPFTLALHLRGTNIFMEMYDRPEEVRDILSFCTEVSKQMSRMYIEAGCDVIAVVEPMASQISSRAFAEFITPYATGLFEEIRRLQTFSSFFVCGHAQKNVEVMCQCKPDNVSVDENIPLDFVKEVSQRYGISFGGNLQLTVMLLMGSADDVRRHTIETIELGGDTGYILAPGCDLPAGVPPENVRVVADVVHNAGPSNWLNGPTTFESRSIEPDFEEQESTVQVNVEIMTLDSEALAPSQYTIEAVRDVADYFGDRIVWQEHTIKETELSDHIMGIMVKNVPIICIDGKIRFVGTIPTREELIQAIQERIHACSRDSSS